MRERIKLGLLISILITSREVLAAGGGEGVPWSKIVPQVVNFTIFVSALYYMLGGKIKSYFSSRKEGFEEQVAKASEAKREAEQIHDDIKGRISDIESNAKKSLEQAKVDASVMAKKIVEEAHTLAKRVEDDARSTVQQELYRNVAALKVEFLDRSFNEADEYVGSNVDSSIDKNLQAGFVTKAKEVQL